MYDIAEICRELAQALRDEGNYGRMLNVSFDERLQAWRVNYDKKGRQSMFFMEKEEVERCLRKRNCFSGVRGNSPREGTRVLG